MSTLSELYLGSEPASVKTEDDQLIVTLADGRAISIPLAVISQFVHDTTWASNEVLILRQPSRIDHVHITDSALMVYLLDGRVLSSPLSWFPRLLHGTPAERNHYELTGDDDAIHWPELDEDIELPRLFEGGKSAESERSIQKWLASRQAQKETTTR